MPLTPVTPPRPLVWHPVIEALRAAFPAEDDLYLVGGAVRDAVLHRPLHDVDLATAGDGCALARRIADQFGGAYYPLDRERGVGRALITWDGDALAVDVARFRGDDLLADLQKRDFTLNAMAVALGGNLQAVFDPLQGLQDITARLIRQCYPGALDDDPVRTIRAVRASVTFDFRIEPDTLRSIKHSGPRLDTVSPERIRDEFFHLLGGKKPAAALRALQQLGILAILIPEIRPLPATPQGPPHQFDVWQHTLATVAQLDAILQTIAPARSDDLTGNLQIATLAFALDRVRPYLQDHLRTSWPNGRSQRALLMLAALLHDTGKPDTCTRDDEQHIHFRGHEQVSAEIAAEHAVALRLSNDEVERLTTIVRHHMRPHWLNASAKLTPRAIYRFWRDTDQAGIDICLLALADYLATYGFQLDTRQWIAYVHVIQTLLERYFLQRTTTVAPPAVVNGDDLLRIFDLTPGPRIGQLLEEVREAQVDGTVTNKKEALDLVQHLLESDSRR